MAKRKTSVRSEIVELKALLLAERSDVDDGILSAAKKVFTDDLKQKKIARIRAIVEKL